MGNTYRARYTWFARRRFLLIRWGPPSDFDVGDASNNRGPQELVEASRYFPANRAEATFQLTAETRGIAFSTYDKISGLLSDIRGPYEYDAYLRQLSVMIDGGVRITNGLPESVKRRRIRKNLRPYGNRGQAYND